MFFFFSKTLSLLIQPFVWILLPLILSMVPKLERWKKGLRIAALALFVLFTNPLLINLVSGAWEYPPYGELNKPVDYAIVLGGMANPRIKIPDQIQFNDNVERISAAVSLYRAGKIRKIIISGGSGDLRSGSPSESPLLRDWAISMDVDPGDIIVESKSQNTHQNALFVQQMLGDSSISTPLLITSASHMRRALGCFEKVGMKVYPYPVDYGSEPTSWHFMSFMPDTNVLYYWGEIIREWIGYLVYDMVGYI